ncbi:MAG: ASCH domain-containing protein [Candidatus Nanopelagicaceae bacterium]
MAHKYTAISVRQPWAWLITQGFKNIENRTWVCSIRGDVALHASSTNTKKEYAAAAQLIADRSLTIELPSIEDLQVGGFVAIVSITDCSTASDSPWFTGPYGWTLSNPRPIVFQPWKGQQGFFQWHPESVEFLNPPEAIPPRRSFGTCPKCGGGIRFPGLDYQVCWDCGTIPNHRKIA